MDKKIKIKMNENKDILISINDEDKITIKKENRKITANEIYDLLSYSNGDNFSVEIVKKEENETTVLSFFYEILNDIIKELNVQ